MCTTIFKISKCLLLLLILNQNIDVSRAATGPNHGKLVFCYVASWSNNRPGRGLFEIENIDPSLCTHLIYAYIGLDTDNDGIRSTNPAQDLTENHGKGGFERIVSYKGLYPHLKVLAALGGYSEGSVNYSELAKDPARIARFIRATITFLRQYNFDGLEFAWEFPTERGGHPNDKENIIVLLRAMRRGFDKYNLILSGMLGIRKNLLEDAYDFPKLSRYLHYANIRSWDYHGFWEQKAGHNSPLYSKDTDNVAYTINYIIEKGMDPSRIVMGVPTFGRTFILKKPYLSSDKALGQPAESWGFQGPYTENTKEGGFMAYYEVCVELSTPGWKKYWDTESKTPFAISGKRVIAYDDERSLTEKVNFMLKQKLAGIVIFSVDTDDFRGDCPLNSKNNTEQIRFNDNFPLIRSINEAIINGLKYNIADEDIPLTNKIGEYYYNITSM